MHFMLLLRKKIPKGRRVMVAMGILNLVKQAFRYRAKVILRGTLGDTAVAWVKKYG